MDTPVYDAWELASNPTSGYTNEFWGQIKIDAWVCALVKGVGKVPYDPNVHKSAPATALEIEIIPLPEMNVTNPRATQRSLIAGSNEWREIGWPSLTALGIANLREAVGRWARVEMVPTGDTYEKDGRTKERTTFKFITLFADEAACRADYGVGNKTPAQAAPATPATAPTNGGGDAEKAAAFQFAKVIVGNAMKGCAGKPLDEAMNEVTKALALYPGVGKYFSVQSAEIVELMMSFNTPTP